MFVKESDLVIRVQDNGTGIPAETLDQIEASLRLNKTAGGTHFGLLNVHERIRLLYGESYGIEIKSSGNGTTVELLFPNRTEETNNDSQSADR